MVYSRMQLSLFIASTCLGASSYGQAIPGSADPSRVEPFKDELKTEFPAKLPARPQLESHIEIPKSAQKIRFILDKINIEGVTAFSEEDLLPIYANYEGNEVSLETAWEIASKITKHYQSEGYFLSRAYVPAQEVKNNSVTIKVVESYIKDIELEESIDKELFVKRLIKRLVNNKPVKAEQLESFMLQINSLPGRDYEAVIKSIDNGAVKLFLNPLEEKDKTSITIDNYGSRFSGPFQGTATYSDSFLPLQQTTLSAFATIPSDEMKYIAFGQEVAFYPDWKIDLSGSYVDSKPGYTLSSNNLRSDSATIGIDLSWQPIRQRLKNLIISFGIEGKNINGDILVNSPLTRDRIRKSKFGIAYDVADSFNGYNYVSAEIHHGLEILEASEFGDANLSRSEAMPDFSKIEFSYSRIQGLPQSFTAIGRISGQLSAEPLYSSEEFGYGGQSFGRAYDSSEITGDSGISGSLELRYNGLKKWQGISLYPYVFYDIGKVWNEDTAGLRQSGASSGTGMIIRHKSGINTNIGIAFPLTKSVSTPLDGHGKSPRVLFSLSHTF